MNKIKKQFIVTFDYELFLGKNSGTVDNCIIKPTDLLIKVLERYSVKAIFFIDTLYLLRLKDKALQFPKAKMDYDKIIEQIETLVTKGYYIFPHIHAHWLDAIYNAQSNTWQLNDFSQYRFHNTESLFKENIFQDSVNFLNEIVSPIDPHHKIEGYRAGGWCIQPFSDFKPHFEKHNIKYDFSVLPEINSFSNINYHDFTGAKTHIYYFNNDVLKEEPGNFCELPVSTYTRSNWRNLPIRIENKVLWHLKLKTMGDGQSVQFNSKPKINLDQEILSIDTLVYSNKATYKKFIKENDYIQMVSHPKMVSKYSINQFESLLKYIYKKYNVVSDFKQMLPKKRRNPEKALVTKAVDKVAQVL